MQPLSQNNKIGISAVAMFILSFTSMLVFLQSSEGALHQAQTDVLGAGGHGEEVVENNSDLALEVLYRDFFDPETPVLITDSEGNIEHVSKELCELLSIKCDNLSDYSLFDFINSKDLPEFAAEHANLVKNGERVEVIGPFRMIKEDSEILVLFGAHPVLDDEGKVKDIVFSLKDITEQVEELQDDKDDKEHERSDKEWLYDLYPKINEMDNLKQIKIVMDKIGFLQ